MGAWVYLLVHIGEDIEVSIATTSRTMCLGLKFQSLAKFGVVYVGCVM